MDDAVLGVPTESKDGGQYYFPDDITDKAVEWLHGVRAQDAQKPWFMFYSTGCAHAPHHVPKEWADKYKGKFDDGWDELRKRTLERQKQLGIVPQDTELTERPDAFPAWDSLDDMSKKLYARQMEVYAGYPGERRLEHRPAAGRDRGDGRPREHPDHLHLGRQRRQPRGHDHRLVQRADVPQRAGPGSRAADRADREVRRPRGARWRPHGAAHRRGVGARLQRTVQVGQADGEPPRRHARPDGGGVAVADQGGRRDALAVHARDRRRSHDPGGRRHPGAGARSTASRRSRWTAPASCTRSTTRRRRSVTRRSTSRCSRPGGCTRTAGGRRRGPTGSRGTSRRRRSRGSDPRPTSTPIATSAGSSTTCPTTSPRRRTSRPIIPRRSRNCRSCGGRRPSATACCR